MMTKQADIQYECGDYRVASVVSHPNEAAS